MYFWKIICLYYLNLTSEIFKFIFIFMISIYIRLFILYVLFFTTVSGVTVKILKVSLTNIFNSNSDAPSCDLKNSEYEMDIERFIARKRPDVLLLLSNCIENSFMKRINNFKLKTVILPILNFDKMEKFCNDYTEDGQYGNNNCFQSIDLTNSNLKFIILNKLLWTNEHRISKAQLDWLHNKLKAAESQSKHVLIAGFNSPKSLEWSNGSLSYIQQYNQKLFDLLINYSNIIKGCFFGNENIDTFRIILDKERKPILPIFIVPVSTNNYIRMYTYNQTINELDNYSVYQKSQSGDWQETYNSKTVRASTIMNDHSSSVFSKSLLNIDEKSYCRNASHSDQNSCVKCISICLIIYLKSCLEDCIKRYSLTEKNAELMEANDNNNGILFIIAVISGFIIILVGIVLAVNKVYCIRREDHRNIFLVPLTLNLQGEVHDDSFSPDLAGKSSNLNDDIENNRNKTSNGFQRHSHEIEQTYKYIRM